MNSKETQLRIACFGIDIVNAAWMKVTASVNRMAESDDELNNAVRAVDTSIFALDGLLRARLRTL